VLACSAGYFIGMAFVSELGFLWYVKEVEKDWNERRGRKEGRSSLPKLEWCGRGNSPLRTC